MPPLAPLGAYLAIPVFALMGLGVVFATLLVVRVVTRWLNHLPQTPGKASTYECGEEPVGSAWFRLHPRFITIALLFLVFDAELAVLWPVLPRVGIWIGAGEGLGAAVKIGTFVGTVLLALLYAWARGDLDWDRSVPGRPGSDQP